MPARVLRVASSPTDELRRGIAAIRVEQKVPDEFPPEVEAAAEQVRPRLPDKDLTDLEFVTIDPESSMDLDQAMHLERAGDGYLVHYAIADLPAVIEPGGPIDLEAHRRGETLYGADQSIPLHPRVLSEGAASLLPDQERAALVWTIALDATGSITSRTVERARVRSRAKLSYDGVQADLGAGRAGEVVVLLQEVGELRLQQEAERGGVSLPLPEQEIDVEGDRWTLDFRSPHPVESWNAQISLLTGIAAADIMLEGGIGILRTLPPAPSWAVDKLRRRAKALDVDWPADVDYPAFVRSLDPSKTEAPGDDRGLHLAAPRGRLRGLRRRAAGAARARRAGHDVRPRHGAAAPPRRPLRPRGLRLACAPAYRCRSGSSRRCPRCRTRCATPTGERTPTRTPSSTWSRPSCSRTRSGQQFAGVVLEADGKDPTRGEVQVSEPAIEAKVTSADPLPVGDAVTLTLAQADPTSRKVAFTL